MLGLMRVTTEARVKKKKKRENPACCEANRSRAGLGALIQSDPEWNSEGK